MSGTELCGGQIPSDAYLDGRRLILKFASVDKPELDRIEFKANKESKAEVRQRDVDGDDSFRETAVPKALGMFFLDYLCARLQDPPKDFELEGGDGSQAEPAYFTLMVFNWPLQESTTSVEEMETT
jgi:hypothetical protein